MGKESLPKYKWNLVYEDDFGDNYEASFSDVGFSGGAIVLLSPFWVWDTKRNRLEQHKSDSDWTRSLTETKQFRAKITKLDTDCTALQSYAYAKEKFSEGFVFRKALVPPLSAFDIHKIPKKSDYQWHFIDYHKDNPKAEYFTVHLFKEEGMVLNETNDGVHIQGTTFFWHCWYANMNQYEWEYGEDGGKLRDATISCTPYKENPNYILWKTNSQRFKELMEQTKCHQEKPPEPPKPPEGGGGDIIGPQPPYPPDIDPIPPSEGGCNSTPVSQLVLLSVPELTPSYQDTYDFKDRESQFTFFYGKKTRTFDKFTYLRKNHEIRVGVNIDDLHGSNYLMYRNKYNKMYYAFIMDKQYINECTTRLIIATDVLQTYLFDYTVKESFVDRCHVDRWTPDGLPTNEFEPEGLEYGENIQMEAHKLQKFRDSYIIVSSEPLGVIASRKKKEEEEKPKP